MHVYLFNYKQSMVGYKRGVVLITTVVCMGGVSFSQTTQEVVNRMYQNDLTRYQDEQAFRGEDLVTRGEIAKFFVNYAAQIGIDYKQGLDCEFQDTLDYDKTLISSIQQVCRYGLMKGYEGNYYPNKTITKAEALTVAIRSILGQQDESMTPWRSVTHEKAQNLGLIQPQGVRELDEPATRIEIGQWLYMLSNTYLPQRQKLPETRAYRIEYIHDADDIQTISLVRFDGTKQLIAQDTLLDTIQPDYSQVRTYTQAITSSSRQYIALEFNGFEDRFVQVYDTDTDTYYPAVGGSFDERTPQGRLRVETCYPGGEACYSRISASSELPWVFPEVRAMGGDLGFVCQQRQDGGVSGEDIFLLIDGQLEYLETAQMCRGMSLDSYQEYAVPDDASLALYSFSGGRDTYWYAQLQDGIVEIMKGLQRDSNEPGAIEYTQVAEFSIDVD